MTRLLESAFRDLLLADDLPVLLHVDNAANAIASVHVVEGLVDPLQGLVVSDKLVDPELAVHVVLDEPRKLGAALDASEGGSLPDASGDELERAGRDLGASRGDADDVAHTPTLVAALQCLAHNLHVAGRVESEIETAVGDFDQVVNDALASRDLGGVHKLGWSC